MSIKLIAIHSIQTTDKDGKRVDVSPGKEFTVASDKEAGDLIAAGAARKPTSDDKDKTEAKSSADGLPIPPSGYAPGTASASDVNFDPNDPTAVDTGNVNTAVAASKDDNSKPASAAKSK